MTFFHQMSTCRPWPLAISSSHCFFLYILLLMIVATCNNNHHHVEAQNMLMSAPMFNDSTFTCNGVPKVLGYDYCVYSRSKYLELLNSKFNSLYSKQAARITYKNPVKFYETDGSVEASFQSFLIFQINNLAAPNTMAGGLALVISPGTATPPGSDGDGLGILGYMPENGSSVQGVDTRTVAIEFDTYMSTNIDTVPVPHVGLDVNSITSKVAAQVPNSTGQVMGLWVDYNATLKQIDVFMRSVSDTTGASAAASKPAVPSFSYPDFQLSSFIQPRSYIALSTSAFSGKGEQNQIYYWSFQTLGYPQISFFRSRVILLQMWFGHLKKSTKIKVIAGCTVGGLAFLCCCGLPIYMCCRKRRRIPVPPSQELGRVKKRIAFMSRILILLKLKPPVSDKPPPQKKIRDSLSVATPLDLWDSTKPGFKEQHPMTNPKGGTHSPQVERVTEKAGVEKVKSSDLEKGNVEKSHDVTETKKVQETASSETELGTSIDDDDYDDASGSSSSVEDDKTCGPCKVVRARLLKRKGKSFQNSFLENDKTCGLSKFIRARLLGGTEEEESDQEVGDVQPKQDGQQMASISNKTESALKIPSDISSTNLLSKQRIGYIQTTQDGQQIASISNKTDSTLKVSSDITPKVLSSRLNDNDNERTKNTVRFQLDEEKLRRKPPPMIPSSLVEHQFQDMKVTARAFGTTSQKSLKTIPSLEHLGPNQSASSQSLANKQYLSSQMHLPQKNQSFPDLQQQRQTEAPYNTRQTSHPPLGTKRDASPLPQTSSPLQQSREASPSSREKTQRPLPSSGRRGVSPLGKKDVLSMPQLSSKNIKRRAPQSPTTQQNLLSQVGERATSASVQRLLAHQNKRRGRPPARQIRPVSPQPLISKRSRNDNPAASPTRALSPSSQKTLRPISPILQSGSAKIDPRLQKIPSPRQVTAPKQLISSASKIYRSSSPKQGSPSSQMRFRARSPLGRPFVLPSNLISKLHENASSSSSRKGFRQKLPLQQPISPNTFPLGTPSPPPQQNSVLDRNPPNGLRLPQAVSSSSQDRSRSKSPPQRPAVLPNILAQRAPSPHKISTPNKSPRSSPKQVQPRFPRKSPPSPPT